MLTEKNNSGIYVERAIRQPGFDMSYEHFHTYCEIFYLKTGTCVYKVNGKEFPMNAGDIYIASPGESHRTYYNGAETCERTVIYCDLPILGEEYTAAHKEIMDKLSISGKVLVIKRGREHIDSLIDEMLRENNIPDDYSVENMVLMFKQILLWIDRCGIFIYEQVDKDNGFDEDIEAIMRIVAERYAQSLSLEEVAAEVSLSPTYLSRKFKKVTGKTFSDYVNFIRLRQAIQKLLTTDDSITEIALSCGFNSSNYFKDCFKKNYGVSPRTYRTQSQTHTFFNE